MYIHQHLMPMFYITFGLFIFFFSDKASRIKIIIIIFILFIRRKTIKKFIYFIHLVFTKFTPAKLDLSMLILRIFFQHFGIIIRHLRIDEFSGIIKNNTCIILLYSRKDTVLCLFYFILKIKIFCFRSYSESIIFIHNEKPVQSIFI